MKAILTLLLIINIGYCQLIQTHWHESYPYNQACPQINGTNTYAGNRSVAIAQLINYWGHPNVGYGEITYSNLWTDSIYCQFYQLYFPCETEGQIANLIFSAGASCKHQFSPYMQNSLCDVYNLDTIAKGLQEYFGYKEGIITTDISQIATSLNQQKPVLLESYPLPPSLGCARYFLLDGYNDGLFHVNNCFGGMFDGWYPIDEILFLNTYYGINYRGLITEPDSMHINGMVVYDDIEIPLSGFIDSVPFSPYFSLVYPKGEYTPSLSITSPLRGLNSTDALAVAMYYTGLNNSLIQQTADVNNDGSINSVDAMLILQKFVGYPVQFYKGWYCDIPTFNKDSSVVILCRCIGDVKN